MSSDSEYSMRLFLKQPSLYVVGTDPEERTEKGIEDYNVELEGEMVPIFELVCPPI